MVDTSNITREQFIRAKSTSVYCPTFFELTSSHDSYNCDGKITCKECWEYAVKDLKFKGE